MWTFGALDCCHGLRLVDESGCGQNVRGFRVARVLWVECVKVGEHSVGDVDLFAV